MSIVILLVSFGFVVLMQTVWDYDFWWHIATGRYIMETGHIPLSDPFSFTSQMAENSNLYADREKFILSQYWLAQVLSYLLYHNLGPAGIIFLRGFLLLGSLYVIYKWLKARGVLPYVIYLALFLAACSLIRFFGDRPVLYTICFSVVSFAIIDDYVLKKSRTFYLLPLLLLMWANLHGGFILGVSIILVFMVVEGIKLLLGRSSFSDREKGIFFVVLFLAIGASWINPNGFFGFYIAFSDEYAPFYRGIQEYQSPFFLMKNQVSSTDYGYLYALCLFPVILILRNRKFNPAHLGLLILLAVQSASAGRFTVYYGMLAAMVLGNELDLWLKEHHDKFVIKQTHLNIVLSIAMLISSVLYFIGVANPNVFKIRDSQWAVPKAAADLILKNQIKGNMLNDMASGGYLAWRLYPEVKTFIDTRALNYTVMREYSWMATMTESAQSASLPPGRTPLWKRLLDHYKINLIVFNPLDVYGDVIPIVVKLLDESDWVPISTEYMAIVFVRDVPENRQVVEKFRKTRDEVYNAIIMRAALNARNYKANPRYMIALGDIFQKMGKEDDAIKAYEYALKRMPANPEAGEKLNKLKKEKTEVKNE